MRAALRLGLRFLAIACLAAPPLVAAEGPVWPPPPAATRVEFVRAFSRAEDLGIAKGFFARLKDFVFGDAETRLVRPMAVVAGDGVIHVADPGAGGVHRFDTKAGDYRLISGPAGTPLPSPVGLARGRDGEVYVTDSKLGQVFVIRRDAAEAAALALDAPLRQPTGIAYDAANGRLYVADTAQHRIAVFAADGRAVAQIGRRGQADGEFNYPTYLCLAAGGRLYVTDSLNFRLQAFDAQGRFISSFGRQGDGAGDAARQKGVATDRHGHIYVVDALFHAFQIFDQAGRLLLPVGERGQDRGEFWLPTGIFIDTRDGDGDTIYVADSYNRRVQVLRYVGGAG